jgi:hypothetical protein
MRMEKTIIELKSAHYNMSKDSEAKSKKLSTDLKNSINTEYLKTILINYFTTGEETVKENLIRVIYQVLKFSDEEQNKVNQSSSQSKGGIVGKVMSECFHT